jgi:hypothetical protein
MKVLIAVVASLLIAAPALAQRKDCEELKSEIDAKIKKNGVKEFSLEIVPSEQVKEGMGAVVGSCDGGTKKIVYKRGLSPHSFTASTGATSRRCGGASPDHPLVAALAAAHADGWQVAHLLSSRHREAARRRSAELKGAVRRALLAA